MGRSRAVLVPIAACLVALGACRSAPEEDIPATESNLTAGMVKRTIVPGRTTQAEVLEVFGPPDLVTQTASSEVWIYDRVRHEVESSGSYFTVLIAGTGGRRATRTSRSTMLRLDFRDEVVQDFRLSEARF